MTRPMSWTCSTKSPRYLTILRLFRLGNAFQLTPISDVYALLHILVDLELLIHIRLKCLWHSGRGLWLLTHWLLQCLLKLLLPLGQLLNHLHQHLLIALLWTSLWLRLHLASDTTNPVRTEAVRQLVFSLLLLDLRTPAPLPCKDILGSYTYVRLVSAQAHSFTRPHESEVNTSNGCGTHIQTYGHVSTCMQLYTYLVSYE